MRRFWTVSTALSLAMTMASAAAAQVASTTTGTVEIQERAGIEATGELMFEDILLTPDLSTATITAISDTSANVTITSGETVVSLSVPELVDVTRTGGLESVTVLTSTDGGHAAIRGFESLISAGGVLSVDVGGAIQVSAADLAPGEYRGLLVVVAQYN